MENYDAGFLIVRPYNWLYPRYPRPAKPDQFVYGIPRKGADPNSNEKRYQGIYRERLVAWYEEWGTDNERPEEDFRARSAIRSLDDRGLSDLDIIFNQPDALQIFSMLDKPGLWEIIWVANAEAQVAEPANMKLLGFEPTWFYGDHFSAVADSMFFPYWHGTDEEGILFAEYFSQLNEHGLFPSASLAKEFLEFYLSFDWTETGDYLIAKVMGT